jgi:hypothetical protein
MPEPQLCDALESLRNNIARGVATTPTHSAWLQRFAGQDPAPQWRHCPKP